MSNSNKSGLATIRRKLAALASFFEHLQEKNAVGSPTFKVHY